MIYLVRHGETEFNRDDRVQGRVDSPLTGLGRAQARRYAERFAELIAERPADWRIVSSPLGRARDTAAIIADHIGLEPVLIDERLTELAIGSWEGLTRAQVREGWPSVAAHKNLFMRCPDGESHADALARMSGWLEDARTQPQTTWIAVSHAGSARVLRAHLLGASIDEARTMDAPQDAFYRINADGLERIACAPVETA